MTFREEILAVVWYLVCDRPTREFTLDEVIETLQARRSTCTAEAVKLHVSWLMCVNPPDSRYRRDPDFLRVKQGRYRLL